MKETLRFIFFRGLYSTLDLFTNEFEQICKQRGYEYCTIHANDKRGEILCSEREKFHQFLKEKVTCAIGFGNMGLRFEDENKKSYWDTYHIPYINMMMDHPMYFEKIFAHAAKNTILLCPDHNHVTFIKRFHPNIRMVEFLPHGGMESRVEKVPMQERKIDVLYAGGLSYGAQEMEIPNFKEITAFDGEYMFHTVFDELIKNPNQTTEEVIEGFFKARGLYDTPEALCKKIYEFRFLDTYITSFYREMTVRFLVENGVHVTVYGRGWEACDWIEHTNLTYKGVVPAQMIPILMQESKIVLNTMTWFKDGSHDRIFNGMLAKAVVVSDTSKYLCHSLTDKKEICFFSLEQCQDLPKMVKELLKNETQLEEISERGYQTAKEQHMWKNRFDYILNEILPQFKVC